MGFGWFCVIMVVLQKLLWTCHVWHGMAGYKPGQITIVHQLIICSEWQQLASVSGQTFPAPSIWGHLSCRHQGPPCTCQTFSWIELHPSPLSLLVSFSPSSLKSIVSNNIARPLLERYIQPSPSRLLPTNCPHQITSCNSELSTDHFGRLIADMNNKACTKSVQHWCLL